MKTYDVTIQRTEQITFRVEAEDEAQAEDEMYGGDEIASKTKSTMVLSIEEVT